MSHLVIANRNDTGPGTVINVPAGFNLQTALDTASPYDTIRLTAGATYLGNFVVPYKSGAGPITVTSSGTYPGTGTRVSPSSVSGMAIVSSPNYQPAIQFAPASHDWRFEGVQITSSATTFLDSATALINVGYGDTTQTSLSQVPTRIVFDRCYIHGDAILGFKRGVGLHGATVSIINSYLSDFKLIGGDSQAIGGWNGPGPYLIDNNYIEGAGENILFGGSIARIPGCVPSDITITNNTVDKPVAWRTQGWSIKNLIELKAGIRVRIANNTILHTWSAGQQHAIVLTPRADAVESWIGVQDVTIEDNTIAHVSAIVNLTGENSDFSEYLPGQFGGRTLQTKNITIRRNLCFDVSIVNWGPDSAGQFLKIGNSDGFLGVDNLTIDHNTIVCPDLGHSFIYAYGAGVLHTHAVVTNNVFTETTYGLFKDGGAQGSAMLSDAFPGSTTARNVFTNYTASGYPANNFYPTTNGAVGFANFAGGDYRLAASSPYAAGALDGSPCGYSPTVV